MQRATTRIWTLRCFFYLSPSVCGMLERRKQSATAMREMSLHKVFHLWQKQSCRSNRSWLWRVFVKWFVIDRTNFWPLGSLRWAQMDSQPLTPTSLTASPRKKCTLFIAAFEIWHRHYTWQVGVECFRRRIEL